MHTRQSLFACSPRHLPLPFVLFLSSGHVLTSLIRPFRSDRTPWNRDFLIRFCWSTEYFARIGRVIVCGDSVAAPSAELLSGEETGHPMLIAFVLVRLGLRNISYLKVVFRVHAEAVSLI